MHCIGAYPLRHSLLHAGQPIGSYILVLATTVAGDYSIQASLGSRNVSTPQAVSVAPGPAQLNRCVVVIQAAAAAPAGAAAGLTAGKLAVVTLNASDRFGNVFDLASYLEVGP